MLQDLSKCSYIDIQPKQYKRPQLLLFAITSTLVVYDSTMYIKKRSYGK